MDKRRVLFICTGNTARSILGQAILRELAGDRFEAHSAGLAPGKVRAETLAVLKEAGYDVTGLRSKSVDEYLGKTFIHYLITVCDDAEKNCPHVWPLGGERLHWSVADPASVPGDEVERLEAFRRARDDMKALIEVWIAGQDEVK